jgi:hypothetical protein
MKKHDANNELGRRLAAAYVSYILGRKSIDRVLIDIPKEIGGFWKTVARGMFAQHASMGSSRLGQTKKMISSLIH